MIGADSVTLASFYPPTPVRPQSLVGYTDRPGIRIFVNCVGGHDRMIPREYLSVGLTEVV